MEFNMDFSFGFLAFLTALTTTLAQQEPPIAPQSVQHAPHGRSAPLLGVRYSASTDVSKVSFNSPLVTYGDSLNDIQLPAAPIRPANLRQASQEDNSLGDGQDEEKQTLVRSGTQTQNQIQSQQVEPQSQVTQAIQPQNPPSQQYISIQQYPARPQLQNTPRGFSLSQNLPGPQPQLATTRYASQYQPADTGPQIQPQYITGQPQYAEAQPQFATAQQYATTQQQYATAPQQYATTQPQYATAPQQYATAQPQYATAPQQYATTQPQYATAPQQYATAQPQYATTPQQYATAQPQQYNLPQPQDQYQSPVAYSSPSSNTYFATGPFAGQHPANQYSQPQYAQPQYAQQVAAQYAQPTTQIQPQYARQDTLQSGYSSPQAQVVSRVAFNGPVGGFSYSF